jgi:hypothetical protein
MRQRQARRARACDSHRTEDSGGAPQTRVDDRLAHDTERVVRESERNMRRRPDVRLVHVPGLHAIIVTLRLADVPELAVPQARIIVSRVSRILERRVGDLQLIRLRSGTARRAEIIGAAACASCLRRERTAFLAVSHACGSGFATNEGVRALRGSAHHFARMGEQNTRRRSACVVCLGPHITPLGRLT